MGADIVTQWRQMQQILIKVIGERYGIFPKVINGESGNRSGIVDEFSRHTGFHVMIFHQRRAGSD